MTFHLTLPAAALSLATSTALAQVAKLEEIIVTAEFRATALQDQAASTSVVTATDIQQRAAQHLEEVLNLAPNVNYASGASRSRYYQIRGIGERSQFQAPLNPSIGFLIDGIDFSGMGSAGTLFDVEQVEILRGPQGTLHGANALAGLINIRSADPASEPGLKVEAMAGDYDTWSLGIAGTGPLVQDKLLYRIAVNTYRSDGFVDNKYLDREDTNNRDETSARGKIRWLAGDRSALDLTAMYIDIDNGYDAFSLDNTRSTLSDEPGEDTQKSTALGLNWRVERAGLDLEAALTWARTETDYSYDVDWSYQGIAPGWEYSYFDQYLRDRDSYSAQLRLLSNEESRLFANSTQWVVGLYYLANREDLERTYTPVPAPFTSNYDTDTFAVFGQLDSSLNDRLTLITGLRAENRQTDYRDNNGIKWTPEESLWGGRLILEYALNDDAMLYAGISRGYRAGGANADILSTRDSVDDPNIAGQLTALRYFDDESLLNYEAGYKAAFMDSRLRTRLAVFYMDRQDPQVRGSLAIPRDNGSTDFIDYNSNAAGADNYGLELELDWLILEPLRLYANIGLLNTEFDDYVDFDGSDLSGREQAHAPKYQYAIGGRWDFGAGFYLRADLEGKAEYYFSDRHNAQSPAQDLLHMRLGWATSHWSLALWCRNLTDEDYFVRGFGSFGNDPRKEYIVEDYFQYGEPRMLGVSASYNF